jgi:beta-ribofuranosylaminobenzene 5'-phosphate synthase
MVAGSGQGRPERVRVRAPARLHLGLIDMNGSLGRRFGSIGLAVDAPAFDVEIRRAAVLTAEGPEADRTLLYARAAAAHLGVPAAGAITVHEAMPAHGGFGSGTQIALAVTTALGRLNGLAVDPAEVGSRLERGARSGIGVAAFREGGFVVDGGRGPGGGVPPVVARLPFPDDWRLLLMLDDAAPGVHGDAETEAFRTLPPMADADVAHLCRLVLVRLLPGLAEADLASVGSALTEIQARLGDHFAPAQGGRRFASPAVSAALEHAANAGAAGVGQSSWGPTGFALAASEAEAARLADDLVRNCHSARGLRFVVARGRNHGAAVALD